MVLADIAVLGQDTEWFLQAVRLTNLKLALKNQHDFIEFLTCLHDLLAWRECSCFKVDHEFVDKPVFKVLEKVIKLF